MNALKKNLNDLHGSSESRKWWVASCSYGANIAVWLHMKYPSLFDVVLADSSPLLAINEFW